MNPNMMQQQQQPQQPGGLDWRSKEFRQRCIQTLQSKVPNINAVEMEERIFQRASSKEEYISFVRKLLMKIDPQQQQQQMPMGQQQPGAFAGGNQQQMFQNDVGQVNQGMQMGQMMQQQHQGMMPSGQQNYQINQQQFQPGQPGPQQMQQFQQGQQMGNQSIQMSMTPQQQAAFQQHRLQMQQRQEQQQRMRPDANPINALQTMQQQLQQQQMMGQSQQQQGNIQIPQGVQQRMDSLMQPGVPQHFQQQSVRRMMTPEQQQQLMKHQQMINMQRGQAPGMIQDHGQAGFPPGQPQGMRMGMPMGQQVAGHPTPQPGGPAMAPHSMAGLPGPRHMLPHNQEGVQNVTVGMRMQTPMANQHHQQVGAQQAGAVPSPAGQVDPNAIKPGDPIYMKEMKDLEIYRDYVNRLVNKYKDDPARRPQLNKLQNLHNKIFEERNLPYQMLQTCKSVIEGFLKKDKLNESENVGTPSADSPNPAMIKTPGSVNIPPGLTPFTQMGSTDALIKVDRPSLKSFADSLSKALTQLDDENFSSACKTLAARHPSLFDDSNLLADESDMESDGEEENLKINEPNEEESKNNLPHQLKMEIGYLLTDYEICLDRHMHPGGEVNGETVYLCCSRKQQPKGFDGEPTFGVCVSMEYPTRLIDAGEMELTSYVADEKLREVLPKFKERVDAIGEGKGCTLVALLSAWKQAVLQTAFATKA